MTNFKLSEKFDVITCFFGAIGYVQNFKNLVKTLENFHKHLNDKGLLIIEPWIFKKDFKQGFIGLNTYEDENVKLARMSTSKITGSRWNIFMDYLIGKEGKITYSTETHQMLAADYEDYIHAFEIAHFKNTTFLKENLWNGCRGLFISEK
jgi:dTDP-3-amino-3,6-dideoxy-alpha-D-glucopyranose N,N-dimethyltransferase